MKTKAGIEKPLAEWTAHDIKNICKLDVDATACGKCPVLDSGICRAVPYAWELIEKPKFTEQEILDAKAIIRISGEKDGRIERRSDGELYFTVRSKSIRIWHDTFIDNQLFPSIKKGESHTFDQIIGDTNA